MTGSDNPLIQEFRVEADQHIEAIEPILLNSEWAAPPPEDINLLFRSFHSIKGLARVVSLKGLEILAHEAETLLSPVRAGKMGFNREIQELLLAALDGIKAGRDLAVNGGEYVPAADLLASLARASQQAEGGNAPRAAEVPATAGPWEGLDDEPENLFGVAELLQELLPSIAASIEEAEEEGEDASDLELAVEDLEVLAHGLSRLALHGMVAAVRDLAAALVPAPAKSKGPAGATTALRRSRATALARLIRLSARFSRLVERDCGTDAAVVAAKNVLRFGLEAERDALQAFASTGDVTSLKVQGAGAALGDIGAVLLPHHPLPLLIDHLACPLPESIAAVAPETNALAQLLTHLQQEMESGASEPSDVVLLAVDQIRATIGEPYRVGESLLKLLRDRKLDIDRFQAVTPATKQQLQKLRDSKVEEFFEVLVEWPGTAQAAWQAARQLTEALNPLWTLPTSIDGLPFMALLIATEEREEKIRLRTASALTAGTVLVRKLDGRQTDAVFGVRAKPARQSGGAAAEHQVRVPVEVLDRLFGRVGEFFGVSSRLNALVFDSHVPDVLRQLSDLAIARVPDILPSVERLIRQQRELAVIEADVHRLISLIHESTLGLRVIPLEVLFGRFPRMVRDTARAGGKSVRFEARTDGIKIDKGMVEMLSDPLMHLLRNAVDHGVETPDERVASGKPPAALLRLVAEQRGNLIVIETSDDGRGIDVERVRAKAVGMGLVGEAESRRLSDEQIARFIFAPGFSTANQITATSGRGVGMDVVLVNVTKLGGKAEIATRAGQGTTFRLELPLSAAIQAVLLAQTSVQLVAFPERMVAEAMAFLRADEQIVNGQRSILLHGRYLPIFRLVDLLKLPTTDEAPPSEEMSIIVCEWLGRRIGVEVDRILRRNEMLIREMPRRIASIPGIGGISTLGTDRIVIVVDPDAIIDLARRAAVFGLRVPAARPLSS